MIDTTRDSTGASRVESFCEMRFQLTWSKHSQSLCKSRTKKLDSKGAPEPTKNLAKRGTRTVREAELRDGRDPQEARRRKIQERPPTPHPASINRERKAPWTSIGLDNKISVVFADEITARDICARLRERPRRPSKQKGEPPARALLNTIDAQKQSISLTRIEEHRRSLVSNQKRVELYWLA